MKLRIIKYQIISLLLCTTMFSGFSQGSALLNFEGILIDSADEWIVKDEFKLHINVSDNSSGEMLHEESYMVSLDSNGWFGFEIGKIERLFPADKAHTSAIIVNMDLIPTRNSKWIDQGGNFSASYKIHKVSKSDSLPFEIARMEGSKFEKLRFSTQDDMLFFSDAYPFIYLQGGFMISLDLSPENLAILRKEISGPKSRGVKGGFAVGGYRKTK